MSYILDALKKSEKERQRGQVPDLLTGQDGVLHEAKGRAIWPYLLLAALLLNAVVLIVWKYPYQPKIIDKFEQSKTIEQPPMPVEPAQDVTVKKVPEGKSTKKNNAPDSKTVALKQPSKSEARAAFDLIGKTAARPLQVETSKTSAVPTPVIGEKKQAVRASTETRHTIDTPASTVASDNKIYNRNELPASVQKGLPDFNITVSIYSDSPSARMIKVNGQTLREGESLSAGLILEEILQNGAIMSYQNYRFRIGLR